MRAMNVEKTIKLNTGASIPAVGLGTWLLSGDATEIVLEALDIGYRHIDTASMYGNEREIGRALKKTSVPRQEIFLTTKVWPTDQGYERTLAAIEESLTRLE